MPLPASGALSLNDIQTEFGGTNPIGLNEYYAGGGLVPSGTTGTNGAVPSSGQISVFNFFGTSAAPPVIPLTAYGWGLGTNGRVGDSTLVTRSSPVLVVGGFTDWKQVDAGRDFVVGIRTDGTAWSWGNNTGGQLGHNTVIPRSSPVAVVGGFTDWSQISTGRDHTMGLRNNGTVYCWGVGTLLEAGGKLGDNQTSANRSSPVAVVGGITNWNQVFAGSFHSTALRSDGTAWAWGSNYYGACGDGTRTDRSSPVAVVGGITNWNQVAALAVSNFGVRTDGTAWTWGRNTYGQLGINSSTGLSDFRSSPVSVVGGFTNWKQITAGMSINGGSDNVVAIRSNGTAWSWGRNDTGQLGDGTAIARSSPVSVVGGFTDWKQVSGDLGGGHSVGVRDGGTAWAWGPGSVGRLGNNLSSGNRSSPVSVVGGFTNWKQITAGNGFTSGARG